MLFRRIQLWLGFFTRITYPRDLPLVMAAFQHRRTFSMPLDAWQKIDRLGGYLSLKEAGLLYWGASQHPIAGPIIELGSYEGRSTAVLALAGRPVHAVDAWSLEVADIGAYHQGAIPATDVFKRFQDNLRALQIEHLVTINQGTTRQIGERWTQQAAVLFIDAGHHYEEVKSDLEIWTPHLHPQGLLMMHDVIGDSHLGVTRAASELLRNGWQVVASAGSIVAFTRKSEN